jgi:hypothetical protein
VAKEEVEKELKGEDDSDDGEDDEEDDEGEDEDETMESSSVDVGVIGVTGEAGMTRLVIGEDGFVLINRIGLFDEEEVTVCV